MSLAKQNFSTSAEDSINQQIQVEQTASQTYQAMAAWFSRDNVALPGLAAFFRKQAQEESEHAQILINYQNTRGGRVVLNNVPQPEAEWTSAKNAIEASLALEKDVNKSLLNLTALAQDQNDHHLDNFLKTTFLDEQVRSIEELAKMVTQLNRVGGDGLGLHLWDQELLKNNKIAV
ncbi:ferritin-like superfamily [Jimgerdemannia flammicorona]|uniref:Ferritin-like superfamily n=2 Tax=Jimgerdemannia flammicorona TaxID=994334 RepID=A0A433DE08_9FUNG|nr:ferritin-like superfamily [Jimgerdemannia flammicorona]RUS27366.1 ferritin-like superfamily [Jimgerdemannia flammicorona]